MKTGNKWAILTGVILAMLLSSLDQTIVSTAMPRIVQELNGIEHLSWVFTAYMLGSTVTVPIYGKLSDIFGRRGLYILGIIIFLIGSILCGLSSNMYQLIAFRGLQGIGGGAMMVNSFAIIGDVFPPAERGKFQGLIGGVFGLSSIAGPLLGGWITDNSSWRWVFYVNIPVGILAIIVLSAALPKIVHDIKDRRIDFGGAFFIITTLVPFLLALVWGGSVYSWASLPILLCLGGALVSLIIFINIEKRVPNPILSLQLFKNRVFVTSVCALFITAMGMFGAILYVPIFSQGVIGGSATHSGLVLTPMMFALIIASAVSGQIISRTGKYKMLAITGTAIAALGMFLFTGLRADTSNTALVLRMIVLGLGLGMTMPIFTLAVQSAFSKEYLGQVTAGSQLFRSVGGTVGTAILGGVMNSQLAKQMTRLSGEPFLAQLQQLAPSQKGEGLDGSMIQAVLNRQNQEHLLSSIQKLPLPQRGVALANFNQFLQASKVAFSKAVDNIFFVSGILMLVGLVIVFFLPEIPLRKSNRPVMEDVGVGLEEDFAQADDKRQQRQCDEEAA